MGLPELTEDEIVSFVAAATSSVWGVELLLYLKRCPPNGCTTGELVRELRSSVTAVSQALGQLQAAGLIISEQDTHYYRPASRALEELVDGVEVLYKTKPALLVMAIASPNNSKLRLLANSFKLKE